MGMTTLRQATPVELAECPADGGKWVIYCEHEEGTALLQDTNKRRLAPWRNETIVWCCYCQEEAGIEMLGGYR